MNKNDPALHFSNPRLLAAIYFGLLSVVGTILVNAFLTSMGVEQAVPIFEAVILGMVVASAMGALFGKQLIHCAKPYKRKTFWLGFSMVMASLPIFHLGLVSFMSENTVSLATAKFHDLVFYYFVSLIYSYFLYGILLAVVSGLAAMYLRGELVYDVMHKHEKIRHKVNLRLKKQPLRKAHAVHRHHAVHHR